LAEARGDAPLGITALVAVLVAAVLAGCGGGGSSGTTTVTQTVTVLKQGGPAPTKAHFIDAADVLCQRARAELDPLQRQLQALPPPVTRKDRYADADVMRRFADALQRPVMKIRQLRPPRGDEAIIDKWLSTAGDSAALFRDLAAAYEFGDVHQVHVLRAESAARANTAKGIAQGYGFKVCGAGK
jgi:hypothetical protein